MIWIDHHRSNDGLGHVNLIDPDGVLHRRDGLRLIGADGRRAHRQTSPPACTRGSSPTPAGSSTRRPPRRRSASRPRLRERPGSTTRGLARALYEDNSLAFLEAPGRRARVALARAEADLVWTYLTQEDLARTGIHAGETDDLIDVIRTVREADVGGGDQAAARRPVQGEPALAGRARPGRGRRRLRRRRPPPGRRATRARTARRGRSSGSSPCSGRARRAVTPGPDRRAPAGRQAARGDLARRRRRGPPGARHQEGRPRRHPRSHGHGAADHGGGPGHPAAAVPGRPPQGLRGHRSGSASRPTRSTPTATVTAGSAVDAIEAEIRVAVATTALEATRPDPARVQRGQGRRTQALRGGPAG